MFSQLLILHYVKLELQVPNGRSELEAIEVAFSTHVNDVSPINAASLLDSNKDELKKFLKWKITKKVNKIYADWPNDLPSPRQLV